MSFTEMGSKVEIVVRGYKPTVLTSDDAFLSADEAMSPLCARCRDSDRTGSERTVIVDRTTGAVLSI